MWRESDIPPFISISPIPERWRRSDKAGPCAQGPVILSGSQASHASADALIHGNKIDHTGLLCYAFLVKL